ncbi:hypothetical protein [Streptomyces sp. ISL-94]|uniref:hypothetical protein n=1 Tax=Streptomyces sp. ISL-94 TaxID=2819190 RepID=UPI001BEB77CA|nr:hypothetical protein [Streptomyces sp. ISL-94]MBT2480564.1 hypothetical protein [Streptomyces sp. ISL-94]
MSTPHRSPRRPSLLGSGLAALLTAVAVCAGAAVARVFPYGPGREGVRGPGHARGLPRGHGVAGAALAVLAALWRTGRRRRREAPITRSGASILPA